jgi:hypothetical protein
VKATLRADIAPQVSVAKPLQTRETKVSETSQHRSKHLLK